MENQFIPAAIDLVSKAIAADNDGEFEKVGCRLANSVCCHHVLAYYSLFEYAGLTSVTFTMIHALEEYILEWKSFSLWFKYIRCVN